MSEQLVHIVRSYEPSPDGLQVIFRLSSEGTIVGKFGGQIYTAHNGTFTLTERLCSCFEPPPTVESRSSWTPETEDEQWWDELCRSITYHPDMHLSWHAERVSPYDYNFILSLRMYVRDAYNDQWKEQHFTYTAHITPGKCFEPDVKEGMINNIRWWLHNIARHEVDEFLFIDGKRRWDPHPDGPGELREYEPAPFSSGEKQ